MIKQLIQSILSFRFFSDPKLWLAISFAILSSLIILPVTFFIQQVFDTALPQSDFIMLLKLGGVSISLLIVNALLSIYARTVILNITKETIFKIRELQINRLLHSSHKYHLQADLSRAHKITVYDTEKIDNLFNSLFSMIIPSIIVGALLIGILFILDWQMALALVVLGMISFWIINYFRKSGKKSLLQFQEMFEAFHRHTHFIMEFYTLIKTSSNQSRELDHHTTILRQLNKYNLKMVEGFTKINIYQELIFSSGSIFLLVLGGYRVISGSMTLGELLSFYFCLFLLKKYFNNINNGLPTVIEGQYSLQQYENFIQEIFAEPYTGNRQIILKGNIEMDAVDFSFPSKKLFNSFRFRLQPGKITLLNGPNGSGKSTLINLILGFYQPEKGHLLAEGISYADIDIKQLRMQISVLFQENQIFNGTILENILYGKTNIGKDAVDKAIQSASLSEFIQSLPGGLQTIVGEKGIKLSGGQRQKIALARCFLSGASVIIMDEPTNHLDKATVRHFINELKTIAQRSSLLLVSHDTELSELADSICTLERPLV